VLRSEPDLLLTSIINNNIIASNQSSNLFESKKKAKALQTQNDELLRKMQSSQLVTMEINKALVAYASNQFPAALDQIVALIEDGKREHLVAKQHDVPIIRAACLAKLGKVQEGCKLLQQHVAGCQERAAEAELEKLNLALAQLDLDSANTNGYAGEPGFVALKLARQQSVEARVKVMRSAEATWIEPNTANRLNLLKAYGAALLELGDHNSACRVYEELAASNDAFLPKYIEVVSKVDPAKGKEAAGRLPSAASLTADVDTSKLEETAAIAGSRYAQRKKADADALAEEAKAAAAQEAPAKRKRKRKPKLPKNLDREIDPERWLPLRDRSYYRGRRYKKSKTGKMRGDQGQADSKASHVLDASKEGFTNTQNTSGGNKKKKKGGKKR